METSASFEARSAPSPYLTEGRSKKAIASAPSTNRHVQARCDPVIATPYVAVFHPEGILTDEQLSAVGLPSDLVGEIKRLRRAPNATIYVLPSDHAIVKTFTSYQQSFAIPRLFVVMKSSAEPLAIGLSGPPGRWVIETVR